MAVGYFLTEEVIQNSGEAQLNLGTWNYKVSERRRRKIGGGLAVALPLRSTKRLFKHNGEVQLNPFPCP